MAQDLHSLLNAARDDGPPPRLSVDDITSRGRKLIRRRRRLTLLASVTGGAVSAIAAVTAALVIAAPSAQVPALDPSRPPALPASPVPTEFVAAPAFTTTYSGYAAGDYLVSDPDLVTVAYQQSSINAMIDLPTPASPSAKPGSARAIVPGLLRGGTLVVYRPGVFNPREFLPAEDLDLRAGTGMLHYAGGQKTQPPDDVVKLDKTGQGVPTLAWQYTAGAWAAIYWDSWESTPNRDELAVIADGLKPGSPKEFPLGFATKSVPRGYQLLAASFGSELRTSERVVSAAYLTQRNPPPQLYQPINFGEWAPLVVSLGTGDPIKRLTGELSCDQDFTVCTHVIALDGTYVRIEFDAGLKKLNPSTDPAAVLRGVAAQDPQDRSDWPPATKVFAVG